MLQPYLASAILGVIAAFMIVSSLPFSHWTHRSLITVIAIAIVSFMCGFGRLITGDRYLSWIRNLDALFADLLVTLLYVIQPGVQVNFAVIFIWTCVFVALYFRPLWAGLHLVGVATLYALILMARPGADNPVTKWVFTMCSAAVLCVVTVYLVNRLRSISVTDPLTGLANRRAWDARLDSEMERARRHETALSLAMIDVDNFKAVNDREGHSEGDHLLCQFARSWQEVVRDGGDFVARLGGDEFGVLASSTNEFGAQSLAQRLEEITVRGVSCSVGVVKWDGVESAGELVQRADEAMFHAKRLKGAA